MAWLKVDDQLHGHKKARRSGVAAMGLWVLAGSWCAAELSDGFVPASVCAQWSPQYRKLAATLVTERLWAPHVKEGEDGWLFHDWAEYQPSAANVRKARTEAQDRMRKLRSA